MGCGGTGMVAHACNLRNYRETEVGGSVIGGQPEL